MADNMDDSAQAEIPRFNLIDEPWIPVRWLDGTHGELGISDTLLQANRIAEIEDASPLVVAALHRFLLAVLYRALEGPTDGQQAKAWFKEGWPDGKIEAYLDKWRGRFWLFHKLYPFGQIPDYVPKKWHAWTKLAAEHNANDTRVLFDHVDVRSAGSISSAKAVRWLLAIQTFALGGGNSDFGYTKHAPSATAVMALPIGRNLADTLMLQLVPQNRYVLSQDIPLWERDPESLHALKGGHSRAVSGNADLYSWPSRSIRLRAEPDLSVAKVGFASGVLAATSNPQRDPMLAYEIIAQRGQVPVSFRERGFWRDFDSLLPDASGNAPQVLEHATSLARTAPERFPTNVLVAGQANSKAKIEYWRMERFSLPKQICDVPSGRVFVRTLLRKAQETADHLERGMKLAARLILARAGRELKDDKYVAGKWVPGDTSRFIGKRDLNSDPAALGLYWSAMERAFQEALVSMATVRTIDHEDQLMCDWLKRVKEAMDTAWRQFSDSTFFSSAWTMRALVRAEEQSIYAIRRKLEHEINKLDTEKESA